MGQILVDSSDLEEIRYGYPVGRGVEGSCYLLEDDNVIAKLFYGCKKNRKLYFVGEKSNAIAFPIDTLNETSNGYIVGYTMHYLAGKSLAVLDRDHLKIIGFPEELTLANLKLAYQKLRLAILEHPNIYMADTCLVNMLYDSQNNKINLIDTSRWYPKEDSLSTNLKTLNWQIMTAICQGNLDWINHPLNQEHKLHELYRMHKMQIESLPMEFLEELELQMLENDYDKVKTIGDLRVKRH